MAMIFLWSSSPIQSPHSNTALPESVGRNTTSISPFFYCIGYLHSGSRTDLLKQQQKKTSANQQDGHTTHSFTHSPHTHNNPAVHRSILESLAEVEQSKISWGLLICVLCACVSGRDIKKTTSLQCTLPAQRRKRKSSWRGFSHWGWSS